MSIHSLTIQIRPVDCVRCGASFSIPIIGATEQARIASLFRRSRGPVEAIRVLRELSGMDLRDAKGTMMHVTTTPHICHRCRGPLDGAVETTCPKCKSLNLDWPNEPHVA
jgi:predicted Zn-ribbon and HTH transcriptional regulator